MTRTEKQQTERESTRLAREYSARGIPLESDVYQKALGLETGDIGQYFSGQRAQTGVQQQSELDQLNNAIALLKAGNPDQSITEALNLYNQQTEQNRLMQQAAAQRQFEMQKLQYESPTDKAYKEAQTRKLLSDISGGGGGKGMDNSFLQALQMIMGNQENNNIIPSTKELTPALSFQPISPRQSQESQNYRYSGKISPSIGDYTSGLFDIAKNIVSPIKSSYKKFAQWPSLLFGKRS